MGYVEKQKSISNTNKCNHKYEIIDENLEITEIRYDDKLKIEVKGYAVFYCSRCLDIQKKVIT